MSTKEFRHTCGGVLDGDERCPECGEGCSCLASGRQGPCPFCMSLALNEDEAPIDRFRRFFGTNDLLAGLPKESEHG